jgi:hypothetical protein
MGIVLYAVAREELECGEESIREAYLMQLQSIKLWRLAV